MLDTFNSKHTRISLLKGDPKFQSVLHEVNYFVEHINKTVPHETTAQ